MTVYKHLFGPVPSRRLGLSLGVDLIPFKTCTLDCVYCECGKTTDLTLERKNYIPTKEICTELMSFIKERPELDYITFSGSGEPTLAKNIGEIIQYIKKTYPQYKLALLTNGTLLYLPDVRHEIKHCDLIKISLDAADLAGFQAVNRPHPQLNLSKILDGITAFSQLYEGSLWLELFIVPELNDQPETILQIKKVLEKIKFEKIQINSLDRPGTETWVKTENKENLEKIVELLKPLPAEIIAKQYVKTIPDRNQNIEEQIISTLNRRPCTAEDISKFSGKDLAETEKILEQMLKENKIKNASGPRGKYYQV